LTKFDFKLPFSQIHLPNTFSRLIVNLHLENLTPTICEITPFENYPPYRILPPIQKIEVLYHRYLSSLKRKVHLYSNWFLHTHFTMIDFYEFSITFLLKVFSTMSSFQLLFCFISQFSLSSVFYYLLSCQLFWPWDNWKFFQH